MPKQLPFNMLARVFNTPLMIMENKLESILAVLTSPNHTATMAAVQAEGLAPSSSFRSNIQVIDGKAVIPVHGTLVQKSSWMNSVSGLTSYDSIKANLAEAMEREDVTEIIMDIDSPGGEVAGLFDLADYIHASSKEKKITAFAGEMACSAAYAIAAACNTIHTTQSGVTGSIGVIMLHCDQSAADEKYGLKYTAIYSGARKADGNPHAALEKDALKSMQTKINKYAALFFDKVAAFRGLDAKAVKALEADTFIGSDGMAAGLVDGIKTLDQIIMNAGEEDPTANEGIEMPKETTKTETEEQKTAPAAAPVIGDTLAEVMQAYPKASAELKAEGATSERARLAAIDKHTPMGYAELAAKAKEEGMTVEAFSMQVTEAAAEAKTNTLASLKASAEETKDKAPAAAEPSEVEEEEEEEDDEEKIDAEWKASKAIRAEFTSKDAYAALRRHDMKKARR